MAAYVYQADGSLFTQTEGTKTTVYLPGEQLTINTSTSPATLSGVRFYSLPGGITAVRTGSGTAYGFELQSDQHGTSTLYLDSTAQVPAWRQFDPYGAPRGTAPAAGFPGSRGFLGKPADAGTGLTDVGARWYDPVTGSFASLDPVLEPSSPLQLNGYSYAGMNPVGGSDPSGEMPYSDTCNGSACYNPYTGTVGAPPPDTSNRTVSFSLGHDKATGNAGKLNVALTKTEAWWNTTPNGNPDASCTGPNGPMDCGYDELFACSFDMSCGGVGQGIGLNLFFQHLCSLDPGLSCGWMSNAQLIGDMTGRAVAAGVASGGGTGARGQDEGVDDPAARDLACGGNSFTPNTLVLLASGKAVPISSLRPGDEILATSTTTGKTSPETVTAVEVNHDDNLYDLNVKTSHGVQVIHTTESHLFWAPKARQWVKAASLKPGEALHTPDGQPATADGGTTPVTRDGWMWDLTIPGNGDHDFYVVAGGSQVLVHNASCPTSGSNGFNANGQQAHQAFSDFMNQYGNGYSGAQTLPSGSKIDGSYTAPETTQPVPVELKPANDAQWRKGTSQIAGYEQQMGAPPGSGQIWLWSLNQNGDYVFTRVE